MASHYSSQGFGGEQAPSKAHPRQQKLDAKSPPRGFQMHIPLRAHLKTPCPPSGGHCGIQRKKKEGRNAMAHKQRSQTMALVLYPEDPTHEHALQTIKDSGWQYCGILHDMDLDEEGELKKPHYHIYLEFTYQRSLDATAKSLGIAENYIQKCSKTGMLRYLIHLDDKEKYQYSQLDVFGTAIAAFEKATANIDAECNSVLEIIDYIEQEADIISYRKIIRWACANGHYSALRRLGSMLTKIIDEVTIDNHAKL